MKIEYLNIKGYKNLENFEMHFEVNSTVNSIIGINGSGKSNVLEALTIIFASVLDVSVTVNFDFCVKYSIDDNMFEIKNSDGKIIVLKNNQVLKTKEITFAIPKAIFLYYSGETRRLKGLCDELVDRSFEKGLKRDEQTVMKYITYLSIEDFGPSLLTNFIYKNETYHKICELIEIQDICSPLVINLKRPKWSKTSKVEFLWGAIGSVNRELSSLISNGELTVIDNNKSRITITDLGKLRNDSIGSIGLFTIFKMLNQADILESIDFDIVKSNQRFSYNNLSEGEKQLAQLLSILDITKDYKALFLLDEFDSYLHPKWQRSFVDILNDIEIRGQVVFTTHSPLTLGKMKRENIVMLKDGMAYTPSSETFNRDVSEVLEELMEVQKRPPQVEHEIRRFRESIALKKKDEAKDVLVELSKLLTPEDPFFVTANISIKRLEG